MPDVLLSALVADGYRWQAWREPSTDREMPTDDEIDAEVDRARLARATWIDGPPLWAPSDGGEGM